MIRQHPRQVNVLHRGLMLPLALTLAPLKLRDLWHDLISSIYEVRGVCLFIDAGYWYLAVVIV